MANSIGGVGVDLTLNSAAFVRDAKRAATAMEQSATKMRLAMRQVERAGRQVQGAVSDLRAGVLALAGALAVRQFAVFTRQALDSASAIKDTADKVGLTTDTLQKLRYAAGQTGVNVRTLDLAMQRFSRRLGEVANGQGELLKTAQQYGISLRDSNGRMRSNIEVLKDFADVIQNAESHQERLRIAFKLFDSEGAALVNTLRDGRVGLEEYMRQAAAFGAVMSSEVIAQAKIASDSLAALEQVYQASFQTAIIKEFAGALTLTEGNLRAAREAGQAFGQLVGVSVRAVAEVAKFAAVNMRELAAAIAAIIALKAAGIFAATALAVGRFVTSLILAARATTVLDAVMSKTVIGTVAKLAIAMGAAAITWEAFGEEAINATNAIEQAGEQLEESLGGGGGGLSGAVQTVVEKLQQENEQLTAMRAAHDQGAEAVRNVSDAMEVQNRLLEANTTLAESGGQSIAALVVANNQLKQSIEDIQKVQSAEDALEIARMRAEASGIANEALRRQAEIAIERQEKINELTREYGTVATGTGARLLEMWEQTTAAMEVARINTERMRESTQAFENFAERAFDRIGGAITDMFVRGQEEAVKFGNVARAILAEIAQDLIRTMLIKPASSFFSKAIGGIFGSFFHSGGTVGAGGQRREVPAAAFIGAPRLHNGLRPDEMPAILQRGETVIPKGQSQSGTTIYADLRGADVEAVARLERFVAKLDATLETRAVNATVSTRHRSPALFGRSPA